MCGKQRRFSNISTIESLCHSQPQVFPMASTIALLVRIALKTKCYSETTKERRKSFLQSRQHSTNSESFGLDATVYPPPGSRAPLCVCCGRTDFPETEISKMHQGQHFCDTSFSSMTDEPYQINHNKNNSYKRSTLPRMRHKRQDTKTNKVSPDLHFGNPSTEEKSPQISTVKLKPQGCENCKPSPGLVIVCQYCSATVRSRYSNLFNVIGNQSVIESNNSEEE